MEPPDEVDLDDGIDWWFVLGTIGVLGMVVSATGEFLGWWDQAGEFGFWMSTGITVLGFVASANRAQVRKLLHDSGKTVASLWRLEAALGQVDGGVRRVEHKLDKLDALDRKLDRIDANTADLAPLLRDIRDELRRPRRDGEPSG